MRNVTVQKHFEWRILDEEGKLALPPEKGPDYDRTSLTNSYETEEQAIADLSAFVAVGYSVPEMVLLPFYSAKKA